MAMTPHDLTTVKSTAYDVDCLWVSKCSGEVSVVIMTEGLKSNAEPSECSTCYLMAAEGITDIGHSDCYSDEATLVVVVFDVSVTVTVVVVVSSVDEVEVSVCVVIGIDLYLLRVCVDGRCSGYCGVCSERPDVCGMWTEAVVCGYGGDHVSVRFGYVSVAVGVWSDGGRSMVVADGAGYCSCASANVCLASAYDGICCMCPVWALVPVPEGVVCGVGDWSVVLTFGCTAVACIVFGCEACEGEESSATEVTKTESLSKVLCDGCACEACVVEGVPAEVDVSSA